MLNKKILLLINPKKSGDREYTELIKLDTVNKERTWNGINTQEDADNYLESDKAIHVRIKGSNYNLQRDIIKKIKVYSE